MGVSQKRGIKGYTGNIEGIEVVSLKDLRTITGFHVSVESAAKLRTSLSLYACAYI